MKSVTIHEAKTHLSKLLAAAAEGEEIVVCRGTEPVAKILALRPTARPRPRVGELTSQPVTYAPDCFAPLSEDELAGWGLRWGCC